MERPIVRDPCRGRPTLPFFTLPVRDPGPANRAASLASLALAFLSATATAQSLRPVGEQLYQLSEQTAYQEGCFPPCSCPVLIRDVPRGGFSLRFVESADGYDFYRVENIVWTLPFFDPPLQVTGEGTYRVTSGPPTDESMHRLELDLTDTDGTTKHLDSGLVRGGSAFPAIDILASERGIYCYDTLIDLSAYPLADFDRDRDVDGADRVAFVQCLSETQRSGRLPANCLPGDFDRDADVDCADWAPFARRWTAPGQPASPAACRSTATSAIPAVSEWGLVALVLLTVLAGTVRLRRRGAVGSGAFARLR